MSGTHSAVATMPLLKRFAGVRAHWYVRRGWSGSYEGVLACVLPPPARETGSTSTGCYILLKRNRCMTPAANTTMTDHMHGRTSMRIVRGS